MDTGQHEPGILNCQVYVLLPTASESNFQMILITNVYMYMSTLFSIFLGFCYPLENILLYVVGHLKATVMN